mmetsp:Transcript_37116/g.59464  ORF Transcript_37116/g.59464 Transcript_37116/m.59464 type:complete len:99 (-) Transcript_37116:385-681(-)
MEILNPDDVDVVFFISIAERSQIGVARSCYKRIRGSFVKASFPSIGGVPAFSGTCFHFLHHLMDIDRESMGCSCAMPDNPEFNVKKKDENALYQDQGA